MRSIANSNIQIWQSKVVIPAGTAFITGDAGQQTFDGGSVGDSVYGIVLDRLGDWHLIPTPVLGASETTGAHFLQFHVLWKRIAAVGDAGPWVEARVNVSNPNLGTVTLLEDVTVLVLGLCLGTRDVNDQDA